MPAEFGLKLKTTWFFDRLKIENPIERARVQWLRRASGQVRLRARRSMRRRIKSSVPGKPPSVHSPSSQSLRLIQFALDPFREAAIVGPVKFNAVGQDVPRTLEFGGRARITSGRRGNRVVRTVIIRKRPFMGPALEATESQLGPLWGDILERQFARGAA